MHKCAIKSTDNTVCPLRAVGVRGVLLFTSSPANKRNSSDHIQAKRNEINTVHEICQTEAIPSENYIRYQGCIPQQLSH